MSCTYDASANKLKVITGGAKAASMASKSVRTVKPGVKVSSQFAKASKQLPKPQIKAARQFTNKATTKAITNRPVSSQFVKSNGKPKPVITYTPKEKGQVQVSARVRSQNKAQSKEYVRHITPEGSKAGTGMKHTRVNGNIVQSKTYRDTLVQPVSPTFNNVAKRK